MRQSSHNFLNSISTYISDAIYWFEDESINDLEKERRRMNDKLLLISSKASFIPPDNPPVLQSKYPILDSHNINTSTVKNKPLDPVYLKNLISEVKCVLKDNLFRKVGRPWKKRIDQDSFYWSFKI